jgi:hypothetical protein
LSQIGQSNGWEVSKNSMMPLCASLAFEDGLAAAAVDHRASDLDQAHTTHARRFHFGMIAEDGDVDASLFGRIYYQRTRRNADLYAVNCQINLFRHISILFPHRQFEILREAFNTSNNRHSGKFAQRAQAFVLHLFGNVE